MQFLHWEKNAIESIAFLSKSMYITDSNKYAIELVTYLLVLPWKNSIAERAIFWFSEPENIAIRPMLRYGPQNEHCRSSRNHPHCVPRHIIYYYCWPKQRIFFVESSVSSIWTSPLDLEVKNKIIIYWLYRNIPIWVL